MNKEFRVSEIFGKAQHRKYHNPKDLTEDANGYPYICASNFNNGINSTMPYVSGDNLDLTPSKIIAWGKQCPVFCYHDQPCVVSQGMYFLDMSNYSALVSLYICGVLTAACHEKYGYVNCLIGSKMDDEIISLPVTSSGTPDWFYMEEYMRGIQSRADAALDALSAVCGADDIGGDIETREWKKFRVGDLFDAKTGTYDFQPLDISDSGYPVITSGVGNNGIMGLSTVHAEQINANSITVDMFGNVIPRDFQYMMVTHARVFALLPRQSTTFLQRCFLSSILNNLLTMFNFKNMCSWRKIKDMELSLPVTSFGTPDWNYMEEYMKKIEKRTEQALDTLSAVEQVAV